MEGHRYVDLSAFLVTAMIKMILVYSFGVICGTIEWDYIEMLVQRKFLDFKQLKRRYVLN